MKAENSTPQLLQRKANSDQSLSPQQIWLHLNEQQQQTILQRMAHICWKLAQAAHLEQEVPHGSQS